MSDPERYVVMWEYKWFNLHQDGTEDFATCITILLPDGSQIRQSCRSMSVTREQEIEERKKHEPVLRLWANRKGYAL